MENETADIAESPEPPSPSLEDKKKPAKQVKPRRKPARGRAKVAKKNQHNVSPVADESPATSQNYRPVLGLRKGATDSHDDSLKPEG